MKYFLFNILLAIAWTLFVGEIGAVPLIEGLVVGYLLLWVSRPALGGYEYFRKIPLVISFLLFFFKELVISNLRVAFDIVTPKAYMQPGVIAFPLDARTDMEITLFTNLLSLTPGTLSLELSEDRSTLYVHGLYVKDVEQFRKRLKSGFEKRMLEVLR